MADNTPPPQVDASDLAHSQLFWSGFMRWTMMGVAACIVILALLAFFLT